MLELTTTRHNPLVDPHLAVWSWEIPVYLFLGGIVAGMMVLAGINLIRIARGDDPKTFFSVQTPIFAMLLLSLGMGALFLDLAHKLYVWRIYLAFEPTSPMSWGAWVLILVYPVLIGSALVRLPESWPGLARAVPAVARASDWLLARRRVIGALGWTNVVLGVGLGIYTGILLNTMVARPLWNSAILGPLFLVSGLSAGAALIHLATRLLPGRPAPQGLVAGAVIKRLELRGKFPLSLNGGVFKQPSVYIMAFEETVRREAPDCILIQPRMPPVLGSALLALRATGVRVDDGLLSKVENSYRRLENVDD